MEAVVNEFIPLVENITNIIKSIEPEEGKDENYELNSYDFGGSDKNDSDGEGYEDILGKDLGGDVKPKQNFEKGLTFNKNKLRTGSCFVKQHEKLT